MAIDEHELRARIASVRGGAVDVRPRAAHEQLSNTAAKIPGARGARLQRLYRVPVLGYGLRVLTAVVNFPRILTNLQTYYATHSNDVARFYATIDEMQMRLDHVEKTARDASKRGDEAVAALTKLQQEYDALSKRFETLQSTD